ncbi:MAG: D-alanine activating enzyme [Crocinitomicaceae bacterium]|jgi:D-alanine--poly(phosphoribitol) ligase subunit 1|nr:D-alanine activating enzyme [Crocinitomicaceae bacterium]
MKFSFSQKEFTELDIQPGKAAVISESRTLSWLDFQQEVDRFCEFLTENKLTSLQNPVIIYGHKEAEMIVAVYACMKLEMSYIPVDVVYPRQRIESVVSIASVDLVINCSEGPLNLEGTAEIHLKENNCRLITQKEMPYAAEKANDPLVYTIFTSGSTGEPKGVQISTEAVQSFVRWMTSDFGFSASDVFINVALFSFDLSVYELMTFSALGATLLLNSKEITEQPDVFLERIAQHGGTVWVSTPSFAFIYSRMSDPKLASGLKYFLFCGEMLPNILAKSLKENYSNTRIYNTYGPTEATVATTLIEITEKEINEYNPLPVGYPKAESRILIDGDEIIIAGKNVSIGYLNRPDLNEQKFIQIDGERAFRTGDNGYMKDGMLFCKGRNDDQVKLHGYRIELNEITAKIDEIEYVVKSETIALRRNDEVKKIVSLVELKPGTSLDARHDILNRLELSIPHYMVPSDIRVLDKMPLNQNGKADKKKLQEIYLAG